MADQVKETQERRRRSGEVHGLYKAREGLLVDGVCSGLALYLGVKAAAVRVGFVLLALAGLSGALLYVLAMIFIPRLPAQEGVTEATKDPERPRGWLRIVGYAVVILGAVLLLSEMGLYQWRFWRIWELGFHATWPLFVIVLGWTLVVRDESPAYAGLSRPEDERMIAGVCAGVGRRLSVDVSAVRVVWAFLTVASWGVGAVAYGALALLVPGEKTEAAGVETSDPRPSAPEKVDPLRPEPTAGPEKTDPPGSGSRADDARS